MWKALGFAGLLASCSSFSQPHCLLYPHVESIRYLFSPTLYMIVTTRSHQSGSPLRPVRHVPNSSSVNTTDMIVPKPCELEAHHRILVTLFLHGTAAAQDSAVRPRLLNTTFIVRPNPTISRFCFRAIKLVWNITVHLVRPVSFVACQFMLYLGGTVLR
jgi:hypothetical protein